MYFDHIEGVAAYIVADVTAYLTGCLLDGLLAQSPNDLDHDVDGRLNDCTGNPLSKPLLPLLRAAVVTSNHQTFQGASVEDVAILPLCEQPG